MVKRYLEWLKTKGCYRSRFSLEATIVCFANKGQLVLSGISISFDESKKA